MIEGRTCLTCQYLNDENSLKCEDCRLLSEWKLHEELKKDE